MQDETKGDFPILSNQFAHILNKESGKIRVALGPIKVQISGSEEIVEFDPGSKEFKVVGSRRSQRITVVPKGWYAVLTNPAHDNKGQPNPGETSDIDPKQLKVGTKICIPGPTSFALWPGQMVKVVQGHTLRTNEFLVCVVYDGEAATENWVKAIIRAADDPKDMALSSGAKEDEKSGAAAKTEPETEKRKFSTGQRLVVKGTEVSFFIPPTGIEVVKDGNSAYVRHAVTLEKLEYCVLVRENGEKRYCYGPAIIFPDPDEQFFTIENSRKFRFIDLNEISGLYVKVIEEYRDEDGAVHKEGEELFITGVKNPIYKPQKEHAIIGYGDSQVHFAVGVPKGEGRYVLDRLSSVIVLEKGPEMLLPDPRKQVLIRRVLTPAEVELLFPGNKEAAEVNRLLRQTMEEGSSGFVTERRLHEKMTSGELGVALRSSQLLGSERTRGFEPVSEDFGGEQIKRGASFRPPQSVVLNTKYEGAIKIKVWTGFAVCIANSAGERRVVEGPATVLLEYDEFPEVLTLSTGTPKTTSKLFETVYLRVMANKVSDAFVVETADFCNVGLELSYRVNFKGDKDKWWNVDDYIKLLCDNIRSMLKNAVKQRSIEEFYADAISIIRDVILGVAEGKDEGRPGRHFDENGMWVYDIEVLRVEIKDPEIAANLRKAQLAAVNAAINKSTLKIEVEQTEAQAHAKRAKAEAEEESTRGVAKAKSATTIMQIKITDEEAAVRQNSALTAELAAHTLALEKLANKIKQAQEELAVTEGKITMRQKEFSQELNEQKAKQGLEIEELQEMVTAEVKRLGAISEKIMPALVACGQQKLAEKLAATFSGIAVYDRESFITTAQKLLGELGLMDLEKLLSETNKKPKD